MRIAKIIGVLVVVVALISVGSVACGDDDETSVDPELQEAFDDILSGSQISSDQFDEVEEGMLREEAEGIVGPKVKDLVFAGGSEEPAGADCAYYIDEDDATKGYRICYENDEVIEKISFTIVES